MTTTTTATRDDRTQLAAMMQRPRERPRKRDAIDPAEPGSAPFFDWKLPPFTPQSASTPGMERGTVLTPGTVYRVTGAHPRFVDENGVTWWRVTYEATERNGQR